MNLFSQTASALSYTAHTASQHADNMAQNVRGIAASVADVVAPPPPRPQEKTTASAADLFGSAPPSLDCVASAPYDAVVLSDADTAEG